MFTLGYFCAFPPLEFDFFLTLLFISSWDCDGDECSLLNNLFLFSSSSASLEPGMITTESPSPPWPGLFKELGFFSRLKRCEILADKDSPDLLFLTWLQFEPWKGNEWSLSVPNVLPAAAGDINGDEDDEEEDKDTGIGGDICCCCCCCCPPCDEESLAPDGGNVYGTYVSSELDIALSCLCEKTVTWLKDISWPDCGCVCVAVDEAMEALEFSYTAGMNAKWCNCFGKQFGGF